MNLRHDAFYEWLLSDAPAACAERLRRRQVHAERAEQELAAVGQWCQRTLANPHAPPNLRALADTMTRISARRNAREAAEGAVPDQLWVAIERQRYETSRRVGGDFDYRYPARYLGPRAAQQPVPDEVTTVGALKPGDRLRLAATGATVTVERLDTTDAGWDLHTCDGRRLRLSPSASVRRVHHPHAHGASGPAPDASAEHRRAAQDPELEL